jgi:predicted metal-dependent peptidase
MMTTVSAERKLKKVKINLMRDPRFALWSGIIMVGKTSVSDTVTTACTNGRDEIYGRKFVESLNDKELAFVVLHENLHKAFRHLTIWKKLYNEDPHLANVACDYVINQMLVDMDPNEDVLAMPKRNGKPIGCLDPRFRGLNSKQVYDILKSEQKNGGNGGEGGEPGDGEPGGGSGDHPTFDEHDWDGASELSKEEKQELEREIDQAIRQGQIAHAKACGKNGGNMHRELGDLMEPQVDWRDVLRDFVKSLCSAKDTSSWRRVNRRFLSGDTYMPTMVGESVGSLLVGIDTSGSISGQEINRFLSEVKAIAEDVRPENIDLMYWDSSVAGHETYDMASMSTLVESTRPKGGGGTDPTCVMRKIKKDVLKPECIIMLTDGEIGNWGSEWESPILWVICNSYRPNKITAPVGQTIHIKD